MDRNEKIRTYNYSRHTVTDHRCGGLSRSVSSLHQFFHGSGQTFEVVEDMAEVLRAQAKRARMDEFLKSLA